MILDHAGDGPRLEEVIDFAEDCLLVLPTIRDTLALLGRRAGVLPGSDRLKSRELLMAAEDAVLAAQEYARKAERGEVPR